MKRLAMGIAALVIAPSIFVAPASAQTTATVTIFMRPPVGNQTEQAWLNCGWHNTCASPWLNGDGLDWWGERSNFPGGTCCTDNHVYWKSWNWLNYPAQVTNFATVRVRRVSTAACYETHSQILRSGVIQGILVHQHVNRSSTDLVFSMNASNDYVYSGSQLTGDMVTDEKCAAWSGPHVHEKDTDVQVGWVRSVGAAPNAFPGADDCPSKPCKALYVDPGILTRPSQRRLSFAVCIVPPTQC